MPKEKKIGGINYNSVTKLQVAVSLAASSTKLQSCIYTYIKHLLGQVHKIGIPVAMVAQGLKMVSRAGLTSAQICLIANFFYSPLF